MAERIITIPELNTRNLIVTIRGLTPLLQNRFSEEAQREIADKQEGRAGTGTRKPPRDPEALTAAATHAISPERYGHPSRGIKRALVAAGGRFAGLTMTHLRGILTIPDAFVEIEGPPPVRDSHPVCIPGSGTWTIAHRPRFDTWQMHVPVRYMADLITEAQIVNLFRLAGFSIGIGADRPENNGTHGQFEVVGARSA